MGTLTMFRLVVLTIVLATVSAVSLKNCGKHRIIDVKKLSLKPSTIKFPGHLDVDVAAVVNKEISGNVDVQITLKKKVAFVWVKVPCVKGVGSCLYKNICAELNKFSCPKEVLVQNLQCHCPFKPGPISFNMDGIVLPKIPSGLGFLASGKYRARAVVKSNGKEIGCVDAEVQLDS